MNRIIAAFLCPFLLLSFQAVGAIIYVAQGGQGTGSSWSDATGDLQAAISSAQSGDEIWIAKGSYFPVDCTDCSTSEREVAFNIPQGVSLFGGFLGTESSITERNIPAFPTILNGNIGDLNLRSDNSYSVLTLEYPNEQNIIDGLIIENGLADGEGDSLGPKRSGGAIHVKGNGAGNLAKLIIRNCIFKNNRSDANGGAIHFYGGFSGACEFDLINCEFEGNLSDQKGGAIFGYSSFQGSLLGNIENCIFSDNRAYEGGAIYTLSSEGIANFDFTSTIFRYNQGQNKGGAITSFATEGSINSDFTDCLFRENESDRGGALFLDGSNLGLANDNYWNCHFLQNKAISGGGAIFVNGTNGTSSSNYRNCDFEGNYSIQSGAALFNSGSSNGECLPTFDKCRFVGNKTTMYGAGMYNFGKTGVSSPVITNCLFTDNEADSGASIYNYGGQSGISNPLILNCTFTTNQARVGPCVYNQASDTTGTVQPFVSNCIFWENIATSGFGLVFQNGHAKPTIQYSIIPFDNCDPLNTQPNSTLTCGPGIIFNQDPLFKNPLIKDYRLQLGSPAIDIGIANDSLPDEFDLDGKNRVVGTIDLGIFEFDPEAITEISVNPKSGEYCELDSITLFIETAGPSPISYQWFLNNNPLNGALESRLILTTLQSDDQGTYHCEVLTANGIINTQSAEVIINPMVIPTIELEADQEFCEGQGSKSVVASFTNGGYFPEHTWILNGIPQTEISTVFDFTAQDQDELIFELITSEQCIEQSDLTKQSIVFEELEEVIATVSIQFDQSSYCEADEIIMTADISNGGNQPSLEWFLNAELLLANSLELNLSTGQTGDQIQLFLTSDLSCVAVAEVESPIYTLDFVPNLVPDIEIDFPGDSICKDSLVAFSANLTNGGDNPIIDWYVNGGFEESTQGTLWENSFINLGPNEISAQLSSSALCISSEVVTSNILELETISCMTSSTDFQSNLVSNLYPNPASNSINLIADFKGKNSGEIQIFDSNGRLELELLDSDFSDDHVQISTLDLKNGYYIGRLTSGKNVFFFNFLVLR